MRRAVGNYELDDDPARIDPAAAAAFLTTEAYWGRWRTEHDIRHQIATAWRVIGAYDAAGAMIGLARAISDGGSAYLADVYVLPAHRGRGLGKAVVAMMVEDGRGVPLDAAHLRRVRAVPSVRLRAAAGQLHGTASGCRSRRRRRPARGGRHRPARR